MVLAVCGEAIWSQFLAEPATLECGLALVVMPMMMMIMKIMMMMMIMMIMKINTMVMMMLMIVVGVVVVMEICIKISYDDAQKNTIWLVVGYI